jgi:TP901 family phage tail tape measure protein
MATTIEARAILSAADKTGGVFANIARKVMGMNAAAARANQTMVAGGRASAIAAGASRSAAMANGAVLAAAGRVLAPAGAAMAGGKALKNFADADLRVTRIGITADASAEQIAKLQTGLRMLGRESAHSFGEVAGGLESLVAGGMDLKDAMKAMPAITKTAQAAGAEVHDIASTTLALNQNLGIATDKMQNAFDILVKGGKEGKFELKDMAAHMASMAPAAVAIGMKGEEGLMRLVAALQTVRQGSGSTEEAASSMQNIFAKMESEETTKKFKKFGIDLRKEMEQARKEGKDLLQVFVDLSNKAVKGDLSKVPQLFTDMQLARGMRALMSFGDLNKRILGELRNSAGSTSKDLNKVLQTPAMSIKKLQTAWDDLTASLGHFIEKQGNASKLLKTVSDQVRGLADEGLSGLNKRVEERNAQVLRDMQLAGINNQLASLSKQSPADREAAIAKWRMAHPGKELPPGLRDSGGALRMRKFDLEQESHWASFRDMPSLDDDIAALRAERKAAEDAVNSLRDYINTHHPQTMKTRSPSGKLLPTRDPRRSSLEDAAAASPVQSLEVKTEVHGEVKGETAVTVKVEATNEFMRVVNEAKAVAAMAGQIRGNGSGSTGRSSPDAAPSLGSMGAP